MPQPTMGAARVSMLAGLMLAVAAVMMLEQSARWVATSMARSRFTTTEFQIDHLSDEPGEGRFAVDGRVVSSGELIHTTETHAVPLDRLRELQAAGKIPGAREPVHYLPADDSLAFLHPTIRFRVQAPGEFQTNALDWTIVNGLVAVAAVWLIRRAVRIVRSGQALSSPRASTK